jgi:DNA modification methylase
MTSATMTSNLQIVYRRIDELIPYERNPRKNDHVVERMCRSIREFGFRIPILATSRGDIVDGHLRWKAARQLKLDSVPVILCDDWTAEQIRAFRLLVNRSATWAEWDMERLQEELATLQQSDFNIHLTGFDEAELQRLLGPKPGETNENAIVEPQSVPITRSGDLWILGTHRLRCGDSTSASDVSALVAESEPVVMVTDPPYGVDYEPKWRNAAFGEANRSTGLVRNDHRADWREAWKLFTGPVAYVWHAGTKSVTVAESLEACGFEIRSQIIWAKPHFVISRGHYHVQHEPCWYAVRQSCAANWMADRRQSTLWQIGNGLSQSGERGPENEVTGHGTQKPAECMRRPILHHTNPGDAVYDPFVGSGTTIIAAEQTGRRCLAMELDPVYVDVAIRRWEAFTRKRAILSADGRDFAAVGKERAA